MNFRMYFFIILVVIVLGILTGLTIFHSNENKLDIPNIQQESLEYGELCDEKHTTSSYEIYCKKFYSQGSITQTVNEYIDNVIKDFKESYNITRKISNRNKAVLINSIDSYLVNDNIVSVRVITKLKTLYKDEYTTQIKTFNFIKDTQQSITLSDIFDAKYKDEISDIYSEQYLLKKEKIIFYNEYGTFEKYCTYYELREYNNSNLLTAENYNITQEEYDAIFNNIIDEDKKLIAITFDDGPHITYTQKLLDILSKYNAKATFFMLGQNVEIYPEVVKSVYASGHEIGMHSWNHPILTNLDSEDIKAQIQSTSDAIYKITGYKSKLVRPPYGSINNTVKNALNYPLIMWSIDSLDWKTRDEAQIVPLVLEKVDDGEIVLFHDIHETTLSAVDKILEKLTNERLSIYNSIAIA